jgi:hypothetical protein
MALRLRLSTGLPLSDVSYFCYETPFFMNVPEMIEPCGPALFDRGGCGAAGGLAFAAASAADQLVLGRVKAVHAFDDRAHAADLVPGRLAERIALVAQLGDLVVQANEGCVKSGTRRAHADCPGA